MKENLRNTVLQTKGKTLQRWRKKPLTALPPIPPICTISDRTCRRHPYPFSPVASPLLPFENLELHTLHGRPSPLCPYWNASQHHGHLAARNRNDRSWSLVCSRCWMRSRETSSCCHRSRCSRLGRSIGCWGIAFRWYNLKDRRKESCSCLWYCMQRFCCRWNGRWKKRGLRR